MKDIAKIRKEMRLSRRAFGEMLGVSPRTVEAWEQGLRKPTKTALKLLECLQKKK